MDGSGFGPFLLLILPPKIARFFAISHATAAPALFAQVFPLIQLTPRAVVAVVGEPTSVTLTAASIMDYPNLLGASTVTYSIDKGDGSTPSPCAMLTVTAAGAATALSPVTLMHSTMGQRQPIVVRLFRASGCPAGSMPVPAHAPAAIGFATVQV